MSEEKVELEKSKEQITNTHGKKKKRIVAIIITAIMLLIVSIGVLCVLKYKEEHRYIPFEELDKAQIVLIQETIALDDEERVYIKAVNAEGDLYEMLIPTDKWVGIEYLYEEIQDNKIQTNYEYDEDMKQMYESILRIDKDAEMIQVESYCNRIGLEQYFYAIRYMPNGEMEYIKYGEEQTTEIRYCLEDPYALKIFPALL